MTKSHEITTPEQLRALLGEPSKLVRSVKDSDTLSKPAIDFIGRSTLVLVATSDAAGGLDISPKGDPAGFVQVSDERTLLIPERKGNKLGIGFHNILETERISALFLVPGQRETLRVNGTASLTTDPEILAQLSAFETPAILATRLHVEQVFFHCGKAVVRSKLWNPIVDDIEGSALVDDVARILDLDEAGSQGLADVLENDYTNELY